MNYLRLIASTILDLILFLSLRIIVALFHILPSDLALKFALCLIKLVLKIIPRSEYVMKRNLSLMFPDMGIEMKKEIIEKHKIILAKNIIGFSIGPSLTKEDSIKMLDISSCEEIVSKLLSKQDKTGTLLLIPHFGNFELLNHLWALKGAKYSVLARPFGLPILDLFWNSQREATGNEIFGRKGGFNEIIKRLKEGKDVTLLFDQNVKRSHGMFVPFFNHQASTTKTIALASVRTGCKILFATSIEIEANKHKIFASWIKRPSERKGSLDDRIRDTLIDANLELEKMIRLYPEQWFLTHRRFKTRPKGEPENWYDSDLFPER